MNTWPPETCQITAVCVVTPEAQPPNKVTQSRTSHRRTPPPRPCIRGRTQLCLCFVLFLFCFSALPHTDWIRSRRRAADKKRLSDHANLQSGKCGNWPSAFLKVCDYVLFKLTSGTGGRKKTSAGTPARAAAEVAVGRYPSCHEWSRGATSCPMNF